MTDPIPAEPPAVPEESTEELYEHAPCGYVTARPDGTMVRVNHTLLRWTGYALEDLLGRRFQELLTVPGRIFFETHVVPRLRMHGEVREATLDLLRSDGQSLPVLLNAVQHRDGAGRPQYLRTMLVDMTERRRYETELLHARRRAEQLAKVVDASGDAILVAAPDGKIRTWNRGAERLFGWTAAEAVGRTVRELLVPPDRADEHERLLAELNAGHEVWLETVRVTRAGRRVDVSLALTPHTEALGELSAISTIIRDISDRRRAKAELRQAERLQTIGTLAGGVAHEVNNQMTAVLGFGEFVRRGLGPGHPQAADLGDMLDAAKRAAQVSRQLLAFSRRQMIVPRVLDLDEVITELRSVLTHVLGADKALVIPAGRATQHVLADRTQLEETLVNLAANARDAMDTGGRLTITTEDAVLSAADTGAHAADGVLPGNYVLLTVADTGVGIDADVLPRIFEPFFTTKPFGQGIGLGLSMVYGVVKQHGGQVWASSEPSAGTTIRVYLPAVAKAVATQAMAGEPANPAALPRTASVLVVEDESVVRSLAVRSLQEAGMAVLEAGDGRLAWSLLERADHPPDIVFTDIVLPGMNGRQLGDAIRARWPDVPVLYTSAYPEPDMRARAMLPHDGHYLQKPFTPDELVARVSALILQTRPVP